MDISVIDDTAHRAAAMARPVAEAVTEAVSGAATAALSGVESVLSSSPHTVAATSAMTAGAANAALRIVRQHPYIVVAGAAILVIGVYSARRRRAAHTTPTAVRLSDVRAAA